MNLPGRDGPKSEGRFAREWPAAALPLVALLIVLPLLLRGPSCGHDFGFHMQSWMDAAAQMRQGRLLPQWAYSPAFNAGEPRFVFYPPLSWVLGSLLLLVLPAGVVPAAYTWLAVTLAGLGMYALGRRFCPPAGALLAAAVYLANPYLLFTAFERTAYAELLAAAWLPWLLRAALATRPSVLALAVPVAALWLTNAPAAVMGTYTLVLVIVWRVGWQVFRDRRGGTGLGRSLRSSWPLARTGAGGLALGLALASFYLLPAAWERRYVQIAMAIIPNMRVQDNFLFGHTGYRPHDAVLHTASVVAVETVGLAVAALAWSSFRGRKAPRGERWPWLALVMLTVVLGSLLLPFTTPLWNHVPELAFLQFPWRWLAVISCLLGAATAMALRTGPRLGGTVFAAAVVLFSVALGSVASPIALRTFRQGCEVHELPAERVALFASGHGVGPTDEYTPGDADNDQLRWDDPGWWLTANPNAPGPGTVPNPAATIVDYDQPPPMDQTVSGRAPMRLDLQLDRPEDLVLNLRDYPAWVVAVNGRSMPRLQRDDGLIAVALPAGADHIRLYFRRLPDVWLGDGVSLAAVVVALGVWRRSRRIRA